MKTLLIFAILLIVGCQRQASTNLRQDLPKDVVLENKQKDNEVMTRKKPCPPNNPHCQTPPPPPPPPPPVVPKKACLLLDFDGHTDVGTLFSAGLVNPSGLSQTDISAVLARVKHDFEFEDSLTITTDETVYNSFAKYKRQRIVITTSWEWFGYVGGVAYVNSFNWDDDTPCYVFSSLLSSNPKYISDATSHEGFHTFGGHHNSTWDENCNKIDEYLVGDLIPGNSYGSLNPYFGTAVSSVCCTCIEDAKQIISNSVNQ